MAQDADMSVARYILPDGDMVLPTWNYVMDQISPMLVSITNLIDSQNQSLTAIDARIQTWLDEQQENGGS